MPKSYIVGNWKMNQDLMQIDKFFNELTPDQFSSGIHWIAPQSVHLSRCLKYTLKSEFKIGAQNCSENDFGAFTGETSADSLKELGVHFTIIGHSERRAYFNESNEVLNKKALKAIAAGLTVIYCCGETKDERENNMTLDVVKKQLSEGLQNISIHTDDQLIIAYEPVWAIGTGLTATPQEANHVHIEIRTLLKSIFPIHGENLSILYGGSVKPNNINELMAQTEINGALVGGASLKADSFVDLCKAIV